MKNTIYTIHFTANFKKAYKKLKYKNNDIKLLSKVLLKIANNDNLDVKYKDHKLENNKTYNNCRECHIKPDLLLIYKKDEEKKILLLIETGSHSELF